MWLCFTKARNEGWLFCFLSKHHFQGLVHRYFQVFFTYSLTPATISDIWPLKNTSTKKKNYVSTTQETEQPHPGLRSTWTPDCKHRQERKKAFAYCGGKNSKFSPFKDKYQGRALPFFFLFFSPLSACNTLHVMVAFRFAWMIFDTVTVCIRQFPHFPMLLFWEIQ